MPENLPGHGMVANMAGNRTAAIFHILALYVWNCMLPPALGQMGREILSGPLPEVHDWGNLVPRSLHSLALINQAGFGRLLSSTG